MTSVSSVIEDLNWALFTQGRDPEAVSQNIDWKKICGIASQLENQLTCKALDKMVNGGNYLVRLLEFSDKTLWVARVSLFSRGGERLQREAGVLQLIRDRTNIPVPQVFHCEVGRIESVGHPFLLMEFIPGNTAMDASGGYAVHRGKIPSFHRNNFYRSVANCHKQIASLRFPKIGTVCRNEHGEYDIGPFPKIGGPFDTATEYFQAWAEHAKFPTEDAKIRELVGPEYADEVANGVRDFPSHIKALASQLSLNNHGPFPLCHGDFWHSNMIIDHKYDVLAVIDWESACTLPWELMSPPGFIRAIPTEFDPPKPCDESGMPLEEEAREVVENRRAYIGMVKLAQGDDGLLAQHLEDRRSVALAYCLDAYGNGKMGFYNRVIEMLGICVAN